MEIGQSRSRAYCNVVPRVPVQQEGVVTVLEDGIQLAVKKLEGVGQGAKEFKAEVSIVGSIHHVHLVKLSVIVQVEEIFPHMTELTSFCSSHLCNKDIL